MPICLKIYEYFLDVMVYFCCILFVGVIAMMKWLRQFLSLSPSQQLSLLVAALVLVTFNIGLKLLPLRVMFRFLAKMTQPTIRLRRWDQTAVDRIIWAVVVMGQRIPGTHCLAKALAAQGLLGWLGYPTQLKIGFSNAGKGQMSAHAWLEDRDRIVVIGAAENGMRYVPVPLSSGNEGEEGRWYLFS
jgi:hypothetical protein